MLINRSNAVGENGKMPKTPMLWVPMQQIEQRRESDRRKGSEYHEEIIGQQAGSIRSHATRSGGPPSIERITTQGKDAATS
jgi:hypothetical protein